MLDKRFNDTYCVYIHTSPSGKMYVGQTYMKPEDRWRKNGTGYLGKRENGSYNQPKFAHAILKYGWDNFSHEIIASNLTKEEANNFEMLLIEKLDTINNGYNMTVGGEGSIGRIISEETRQKMSESHKGKSPSNKGVPCTEEKKQKISEANKGRLLSEETRQKMRGRTPHNKGKHTSEEIKQKQREAKLYKLKAVICLETQIVYASISEAGKATGIRTGNISSCCNSKRKTAGGYTWKFYNEEEVTIAI